MNGRSRVWILEDDPGCIFVYGQVLGPVYDTKIFSAIKDFRVALAAADAKSRPHLLIADLMLSDGSFLDFIDSDESKSLFEIPFLVISSLDDVETLRFCLEEGAIDYLVKPFKKNELTVKTERALLRPSSKKDPEMNAIAEKIRETLTKKEVDILEIFLKSPEKCARKRELESKVWQNTRVHPKSLHVHLYNLRKKISKYGLSIEHRSGGEWVLLGDRMDHILN